jgi:nucleoside permease NupC
MIEETNRPAVLKLTEDSLLALQISFWICIAMAAICAYLGLTEPNYFYAMVTGFAATTVGALCILRYLLKSRKFA